jgi:hypothetical protein
VKVLYYFHERGGFMPKAKKVLLKIPSGTLAPEAQRPKKAIPEKTLIEWSAPEFVYYKKKPEHFIIPGLFATVLIFLMIILRQWITVIAILLAVVVLYLYSQKKPQVLSYAITTGGVKIGRRFHNYDKLKSFWIISGPSSNAVYFESVRKFSLPIIAQLGDCKPEEVRKIVKTYLSEQEGREEDFIDKIFRLIRF